MASPLVLRLRSGILTGLRWSLLAVILALLLVKGGTPWPAVEAAAIPLGLIFALSLLEAPRNADIGRFMALAFGFATLLALYVGFQALPLPGGLLANPIWSAPGERLGLDIAGSVSVVPGQSPWSLLRLLMPFVVFLTALALFQYEKDTVLLWKCIAGLGTAFALYGILQLLLFPSWLLFEEKRFYTSNLSGTLVNRNSAATLLGLTFLATLALFRREIRRGRQSSGPDVKRYQIGPFRPTREALVWAGAGVLQVLAIGMTASRGGLLSTAAATVLAVPLLDFRLFRDRIRNRFVIAAVVGLLVLLVAEVFAGRTLFRLEAGESEGRLCAFRSTVEAAMTNLPFGTGLGSFQDVFPSFRDPACFITGTWELAHNSYLENLLELGLPYVVFLVAGLVAVVSALRTGLAGRREYRPFVVAGLAGTLLVTVHATVDFSLQIPAVTALYALMLASAIAVALGRGRVPR
ncbi:O-antigen ligase family protein [Polymorphum gilvum]|uniref:Endo-1,4-beta-xylanase protein (Exopolysaccharide export) n=1 Tax=Polymorphum gilvum (strain LMG 25793 / CGMCC 1.9160 / SL003B-26A1) TaxID=991905 RepID=F2IW64_POLGS|nr:O-antigen ligase family protein [Polymorphum gilvum]ADZ71449.1 Endo-1,4-beta-xylanase protein (Exopolysaccharide export) [Polymorphum gilvum SL003B-26A1]